MSTALDNVDIENIPLLGQVAEFQTAVTVDTARTG